MTAVPAKQVSNEKVLLGDEAVATGALDAGISAAYSYPGTPATEIAEYLVRHAKKHGRPHASWTTNEKTAYEEALGASMVGRRALVSMKHVGLNVAADPFMNSAIIAINGGLVVAVADDPGMHSSQNEQDTRYFADFAHTICLEPATQQQAYDMTREGFDLSERFQVPVVIRLVTRLAHSRAVVQVKPPRPENDLRKAPDPSKWILLPGNARKGWQALLDRLPDIREYTETCVHNVLTLNADDRTLGVITTGTARNYFLECAGQLKTMPSHLHVGAYPLPVQKIRKLLDHVERVLVIEEGYPLLEGQLRGLLPEIKPIAGKLSGELPLAGELNTDLVRKALGLSERTATVLTTLPLPGRPPQLCSGCPHQDSFKALKDVLKGFDHSLVSADIGCYTLGALPPYEAIESCVCMGASVGLAKGAAEAGFHPAVAVIGDSTFLHSGVTPLMDAVAADANMTLLILDNGTVGMTGGQPTMLSSSGIEKLVLGTGVNPEHFKVIEAHPKKTAQMAEVIRKEIDHRGLSVIIMVRECLETARRSKKKVAS